MLHNTNFISQNNIVTTLSHTLYVIVAAVMILVRSLPGEQTTNKSWDMCFQRFLPRQYIVSYSYLRPLVTYLVDKLAHQAETPFSRMR